MRDLLASPPDIRRDYSRTFHTLGEIYQGGLNEFIEDLARHGFEILNAELLSAEGLWAQRISKLCRARSSDAQDIGPEQRRLSFCYLSRPETKLVDELEWGMVICSQKTLAASPGLDSSRLPLLCVKEAPDALVDHLLKRMLCPEWTMSQSSEEPLATRFPNVHFESPELRVGPHTRIGAGTVLESFVRIGARVQIGEGCRIRAFSRIADDTVIGNGVDVGPHAAIGGQGFGFLRYPGQKENVQRCHVGRVRIGDGVRLGAFLAVDRGVFEENVIGHGVAFDNLVHVGHNCVVGEHSRICGFVALSGSSLLGSHVNIGGMVGTKGHIRIGDNVTIAAQSGVSCDLESGAVVKGYPPRPLKEALKIAALQGRLPDIYERLRFLEKNVDLKIVDSEKKRAVKSSAHKRRR